MEILIHSRLDTQKVSELEDVTINIQMKQREEKGKLYGDIYNLHQVKLCKTSTRVGGIKEKYSVEKFLYFT